MYIYTTVVFLMILVSSCAMMYFSIKTSFLDSRIVFVITGGSILASICFPKAVNIFLDVNSNHGLVNAALACIMLYIAILLFFSCIASMMIKGSRLNNALHFISKSHFITKIREEMGWDREDSDVYVMEKSNVLQGQTSLKLKQGKNIFGKPVDTEKNIDKMKIETNIVDSISSCECSDELVGDSVNDGCELFYGDTNSQLGTQNAKDGVSLALETDGIDSYETDEDYFDDESKDGVSNSESQQEKALDEVFVVPDRDEISIGMECEKNNSNKEVEKQYAEVVEKVENMIDDEKIIEEIDNLEEVKELEEVNEIDNKIDNEEKNIIELDTVGNELQYISDISDIYLQEVCIAKEDIPESCGDAVANVVNGNKGLDECIDEAFRLKEAEDREGAILNYLYALDHNPEDDMVFWLVLDICVLYKELGQVELARDILVNYVDKYKDVMDESVRLEIERNL